MTIETKLIGMDRASLVSYVVALIDRLVPDGKAGQFRPQIDRSLDEAVERTMICINRSRLWKPGGFSYLHSSHFCTFLYLLANSIWKESADPEVCTRLFIVNKALNGIDLFYQIELPEPFFIGHSVGIVLARASYGKRVVLYQNSTVGKGGDYYPEIGNDVILYPNSAVIGRCRIGDGTIVSQGVSVINRDTPGNTMVFPGEKGALLFKEPRRSIIEDYFRSDDELKALKL